MGLLSSGADTFYAFRFLRLLTTPWEKTKAFQAGLIDKDGNVLRKPETSSEKSVYNLFHKLVFNLKRLLNKFPLGKTTLASYFTGLYLIKENLGLTDQELLDVISEFQELDIEITPINECKEDVLYEGAYTLKQDVPNPLTLETLALEGHTILVESNITPHGFLFGIPAYKVVHELTNTHIIISKENLNYE